MGEPGDPTKTRYRIRSSGVDELLAACHTTKSEEALAGATAETPANANVEASASTQLFPASTVPLPHVT